MKFLQIHTYYAPYLREFSSRHPELELSSHSCAMKTLLADGFSACHMLAPYLNPREWNSRLIIPNFVQGQNAWRREHGMDASVCLPDLLRRQIAEFDPDVLYLTDPVTYDSAFVRSLGKRPPLVIGWRAAPVLPATDWSEFDVIVSNHEPSLQLALQRGAKAVERFHPGFPSFLAEAVKDEPEVSDVTFCGQWGPDHAMRNQWWLSLAKATLSQPRDFQLDYYLLTHAPECLPAAVSMFNHGACFGIEMHRVLKRGRVCLNAMIDMGQGMSANMRLFEIAGTGSFQLMEHHDDIAEIFEPGVEIETYHSKDELLEKVFYYLDHPEPRRAIAKCGQDRCLRDYSMERRTRDFEEIIRRQMKSARHRAAVPPALQMPVPQVIEPRKPPTGWRRRLAGSLKGIKQAFFPKVPKKQAIPPAPAVPNFAEPPSNTHSFECRPRPGYCPACGSQVLKHLTRRPYSQTFVKWGIPSFHGSDIMPRLGDPFFEIIECRTCGLYFVPERPHGLVETLENDPKFFSLVVKDYLEASQPIVTQAWLNYLITAEISSLSPFDQHHRYLLEFVLARILSHDAFLDLGCNMGGLAQMVALSRKESHVAGCELNPYYCDEFSRRYPALALYRGTLGSAGVDRKYDLIYCSDVIEHIWNLDAFVQEILGVLAEGGRVIFVTPNLECEAARLQGWDWWGYILPHHCQLFGTRSLPALLRRFNLVTVETVYHRDELIIVCHKSSKQA